MRVMTLIDTLNMDNVMPTAAVCHGAAPSGPTKGPSVHGGWAEALGFGTTATTADPSYLPAAAAVPAAAAYVPAAAQPVAGAAPALTQSAAAFSSDRGFMHPEYIPGIVDSCCGTFPIVNLYSSAMHKCIDDTTGQVELRHMVRTYQR